MASKNRTLSVPTPHHPRLEETSGPTVLSPEQPSRREFQSYGPPEEATSPRRNTDAEPVVYCSEEISKTDRMAEISHQRVHSSGVGYHESARPVGTRDSVKRDVESDRERAKSIRINPQPARWGSTTKYSRCASHQRHYNSTFRNILSPMCQ